MIHHSRKKYSHHFSMNVFFTSIHLVVVLGQGPQNKWTEHSVKLHAAAFPHRGQETQDQTANIFEVIFTVFKCVQLSTAISLYGLHLITAPSTVEKL